VTETPRAQRRSWLKMLALFVLATLVNAVAVWLLAWIIPGFKLEGQSSAIGVGFLVALVNAAIWPTIARLALPITVLTLGIGSLVLNALILALIVWIVDGAELDNIWAALGVVIGLAVINALVSSLLHFDDEQLFDQRTARRAKRHRKGEEPDSRPGVVLLQIDGLGIDVLRRSLGAGDVPNLSKWIRTGTHHVVPWHTEWSSQTGVSQAGLLLGSTDNMPAFRWYDKASGETFVSNHPESAAAIESTHQVGEGLLGSDGSSYGNLYTGGAERAILTMSVVGRRKEGRIGAGYGPYFAHPHNVIRTFFSVVLDVYRERREASAQKRRDVQPRVHRGWSYALLRSFTTVIMRDVCVSGVIGDMAEGRRAIYFDFLGYDEVAHHSGIERHDSLAVLRDIDRQIGRIDRARAWAGRPYEIVVLSDHGQTQGATFKNRYDETLEAVVRRNCGLDSEATEEEEVQTEARGYLDGALADVGSDSKAKRVAQSAQKRLRTEEPETAVPAHQPDPIVMASGNLGLVYFPDMAGRATRAELESRHPGLIDTLVQHPGVGFVLVSDGAEGSLVLGQDGVLHLGTGAVDGEDPLELFGPLARTLVERADGFESVGDLMINSLYDPQTDEVAAFEELVGSHGGMGGPQTRAFLLVPSEWESDEELVGPAAVHWQLRSWMDAAL
jgi:uncharacterized membrane protein YvlD (DUF360 family)